jgi:hypothetical protein
MNKSTDSYLDILKEVVLDADVRTYAGIASHNLSETLYKSNVLPGNIIESNDSFTPVFMSYELLPVKKAINIRRIVDYYLWAYDEKLTESEKMKGRKNCKTLLLLLSGISEGTYKIEFINTKLHLKSNSSYGYTKKYSYGRLYPIKASISHLSREFRYYLFKGLYNDVDIINAHPSILYNYAVYRDIPMRSLSTLVNNRELFYAKIKTHYGDYSKIDPKKLALIALNTYKTDFKSDLLNNLTRDLNEIREKLYEEFYLNDSEFRSAIDLRCNLNTSKKDILTKTQSLFCFNRETECVMSFKDFYLNNIHTELRESTSFVPFYDGMYIYSDSISYLNVKNMCIETVKTDLDDIIDKYNSNNTIKFKHKHIEMEDELIPHAIFNEIKFAINLVENMNYQEILHEFNLLGLGHELINPLRDILNSSNKLEIDFDYKQLTYLQDKVRIMYHKLIHSLIMRHK